MYRSVAPQCCKSSSSITVVSVELVQHQVEVLALHAVSDALLAAVQCTKVETSVLATIAWCTSTCCCFLSLACLLVTHRAIARSTRYAQLVHAVCDAVCVHAATVLLLLLLFVYTTENPTAFFREHSCSCCSMVSRLLRRQAPALRSNYLAAKHCLKSSSCSSSRCFATSGRGQPGAGDQSSLGIYSGDHVGRRLVKPERIIIVRHGESMGNLDEVSKWPVLQSAVATQYFLHCRMRCDAVALHSRTFLYAA
jgi:hypothetical protein